MAQERKASTKPKVVFDVKMPKYEYRKGDDRSMSVDRPRKAEKVAVDCLANLAIGS